MTVERGVGEVVGQPPAERRRGGVVLGAVPEVHGQRTSARSMSGADDLQLDVAGQAGRAPGPRRRRRRRPWRRRRPARRPARPGGPGRRPPARAPGPGRGRTATARSSGPAARRRRPGPARRRARRAPGGRRWPRRARRARRRRRTAAARRRCRPGSTSAGWRAATARPYSDPADQARTPHGRIPRWAASAAASSANEPTVPSRVEVAAAGPGPVDGDQPDAGRGGGAVVGMAGPPGVGRAVHVEHRPPVGSRRRRRSTAAGRRRASGSAPARWGSVRRRRGRERLSAGSFVGREGRVAQLVRAPP